MHRRSVLQGFLAGSVAALSGCTSIVGLRGDSTNDITVRNERQRAVSFDVVVAGPDGGTVSSTRHKVPPAGTTVLEDVADDGEYDLTIAVDGLPSASHDWTAEDCRDLTVEITAEAVKFVASVC